MNPEALLISNTISRKRAEILYHNKNITLLENEISDLNKKLRNTCYHEWVRDWEDRSSKSSWICKNCKLYRNPNYN